MRCIRVTNIERSVATHLEIARFHHTFAQRIGKFVNGATARKKSHFPFSPCYVFIRGGMERQISLLSTPGVHSIVCTGKIPAAVADDEIAAIRRAMDHSVAMEPAPFICEGDRVRVVWGPCWVSKASCRGVRTPCA